MRSNKFNKLSKRGGKIPALSVLNERQNMDNKIKKIRELNDNLQQNFSAGETRELLCALLELHRRSSAAG